MAFSQNNYTTLKSPPLNCERILFGGGVGEMSSSGCVFLHLVNYFILLISNDLGFFQSSEKIQLVLERCRVYFCPSTTVVRVVSVLLAENEFNYIIQ